MIVSTLAGGRRGDSVLRGLASEMRKKKPATMSPVMVICMSPCFTPMMVRRDRMRAVTRQFTPRIL